MDPHGAMLAGPEDPSSEGVVIASAWNSLEVAKLLVSVLTPLLLVGIGYLINQAGRRVQESQMANQRLLEDAQWGNRKLIERRLDLYGDMAPRLNDLLCFFTFVGDFKEIAPDDAVAIKRQLDKAFYVNRFLFSDSFSALYGRFMSACFRTFTGSGRNALLRSRPGEQARERGLSSIPEDWQGMFVDEDDAADMVTIRSAYEELMTGFANEIGVHPLVRS